MSRRLFALDQNFPQPIISKLDRYMPEAELVSIREIHPRMSVIDDWEVLLALHHHDRDWDGLITTDSGMLKLPRELATVAQTKLTLVVATSSGDDPLKATGLVLAHLPGICKRTRPDAGQIWELRTATKPGRDPWDVLNGVATHRNVDVGELYNEFKLGRAELSRNPLS
jgi:hypothetical protein